MTTATLNATEYNRADNLESGRRAADGAMRARKAGAYRLESQLWTSAADRLGQAGRYQAAEAARQYAKDALAKA
jgi:hypothetical protein